MNQQTFDRLFAEQVDRSRNVLCEKAKEYAIGDRLHNFKVAAELQNCSVPAALAGMMAKHTISVYDMCKDPNWEDFSLSLWEEKLGDHINYLFLLNAAVREAYAETEQSESDFIWPVSGDSK